MTAISPTAEGEAEAPTEQPAPACVMSFNVSDPSGAGGSAGDVATIAAMGAHALPVVTSIVMRDTAEIFDHHPIEADLIVEQARSVLEDVTIAAWKVGFLGSTEGVSTVAEILADYPDVPLVTYLPNLAWVEEDEQQSYLDAFRELVLPQTEVLVGNHQTLADFLLPDWNGERPPSSREIAIAASKHGARYVLVTGVPLPDQFIDNVLANAAGRDHRREVRALRDHLRRRRRHPVRRRWRRCWPPASSCTPRSARRWPSSTRPRRGLPPGHGQRHPRPLLLGPARGRRGGRRRAGRSRARRGRRRGRAAQSAPCPLAAPGSRHERGAVRTRPRRHPRRRQFAGARLPRRRRHAALHRRAPRAPTSGTPRASATSTTSAPGAR